MSKMFNPVSKVDPYQGALVWHSMGGGSDVKIKFPAKLSGRATEFTALEFSFNLVSELLFAFYRNF